MPALLPFWCAAGWIHESLLCRSVEFAGLIDGTSIKLASDVQYSLGSTWSSQALPTILCLPEMPHGTSHSSSVDRSPVPATEQIFVAVSDPAAAHLASADYTAPAAPEVFTTFLLGTQSFGYSLIPLLDAPETGPCKPP